MTMSSTDRALLENFIVDNEELDNLESKLAQFNIFEAIGVVRQEIRHSNFLAFLLNPSQNHRLDDLFLKQFLKRMLLETEQPTNVNYANISSVDIDISDLTDAEVKREWQNIDIFIHSPRNKLVCAIENKVDSGEHSDQLERYRKIIENQYSNYRKILIYLTPKGNKPSDENWRIYKYSNVVELIDNICASYKSTFGGDVYTLITHYSTLIKRHIIMSDSEVADLCRKIYYKHKQALDLIFEYRLDLQLEIASIVYDIVTKDINNKKGSVLLLSTKSVGFDIKEWKDVNLPLYFYFDNDAEYLRLQLGISSGEASIREKIYQFSLNNPTIFNNATWSDRWIIIYQKNILNSRDYKVASLEDLIKKIQECWDNFIKDDFLNIEKIINENIDKLINLDISVYPEA